MTSMAQLCRHLLNLSARKQPPRHAPNTSEAPTAHLTPYTCTRVKDLYRGVKDLFSFDPMQEYRVHYIHYYTYQNHIKYSFKLCTLIYNRNMYKRYLSIPTYILTGTHRPIQYLHVHTIHIHIMELDLIVAFYFSISKKYKNNI